MSGDAQMGMFDDNSDDEDNSANQLVQQQIQQNEQALEQQRASLNKTRMDILHSEAGPDYSGSNKNAPVIGK